MPDLHVTTLAIALDADARPAIQGRMRELAEEGDTKSAEGRARMLSDAIALLLDQQRAFTHAHWSALSAAPDAARAHFTKAATEARARFPVEVIRNADGQVTHQAPPELKPTDAPGVVLVTMVVAQRVALAEPKSLDRTSLAEGLRALAKTSAAELVAMEVIWSPAEDRDRVDAAELLAKHPEVRALEPRP
jgi:uncharacterized membrane protein